MPTAGPRFPTAATGNTNTIGGGTVAWTNPTNIEANDGASATILPGTATTDDLRGGGFGFSIASTDTILGIILEVGGVNCAANGVEQFNTVALEGGGGASANRAAGTFISTTLTTYTFGGSSDLWGTTWTPAQINAGGFVGNISFSSTGTGPGTISVDFFRITVVSSSGRQSAMLMMF